MTEEKTTKASAATKGSKLAKYRNLNYGDRSFFYMLKAELITALTSSSHGAWGLFWRSKLYPCLFASVGKGVVFGRNITLRHPHKIRIGDNVIVDDNAVIDAKGEDNEGITIGSAVYIGRNSIVYCKGGNISLGDRVNISSSCTLFSSNDLKVGDDTIIGAYSYLLSGGEYDYENVEQKFSEQSGMVTKGPLEIGSNCWLGARVTVLDAASIGNHCVIGAGSVVNKAIEANTVAVGVPAKVTKRISNIR